ncbi:MAG: sulfatase-like hydrolase/transferase, partial [Thermodesulfovibrionales bacterium]|nr:sulfatase-like hydrolase/transferase [Thermodesulfovibrionales bacterium]
MSISRRNFIKLSTASLAMGAMPQFAFSSSLPSSRPNVLFIAIDDLNDWVGCMGGHPDARTPNIDKLSKRGVLFTNAHTSAPICGPSRTSLMTGLKPSTTGQYHNHPLFRHPDSPDILKNAITIPQHFMKHEYRAISGGKIFHGTPDP